MMKPGALLRPGRPRPSAAGVVSCLLVVAGLVLGAAVDMAWLVLFALGAFGPSVLRAVGLLDDLDEFQRTAAQRAAFHAYLAGGLFLCTVTIVKSWGAANLDHDQVSASAALAVLSVAYFMSRLVSFWGAPSAAFRVLLAFGFFWLAFVVMSHRGSVMAKEALVVLPFFLLALTSRRWPRTTGILLIGAAAATFVLLRLGRAFQGDQGAVMVTVILALPLFAMGLALLAAPREETQPVS